MSELRAQVAMDSQPKHVYRKPDIGNAQVSIKEIRSSKIVCPIKEVGSITPGVSIIIPAHNAAETIGVAIYSILSQRFQGAYEIIVVNDGSTDDLEKELYELAPYIEETGTTIKIITLDKNYGSSIARNIALTNSSYDTILPFDADDMLVPPEDTSDGVSFMQKAYDILTKSEKVDVVFSDIQNFGALTTTQIFPEFDPKTYLERCTIWTPAMHRRQTAYAMGGWDTSLSYVQDFAYWAKMLQYKEQLGQTLEAIRIPEPLYLYRRYPIAQISHESASTINNHRLGWRLLIERFPELYVKYFPHHLLEELPDHFHENEMQRRGVQLQ